MNRIKWLFLIGGMLFCSTAAPVFADESRTAIIPEVPTPGLVTMLDLGTDKCIPCKMMAPIIEELQEEYDGRSAITFIDVWKNKDQAKRFGISSIPTQIFFDRDGKEVQRHAGFLDKKSILEIFEQLGVSTEHVE